MKKSKKIVYRIGDKVKIVNPEVYVKTGYPIGIKDGLKVVEEFDSEIKGLLYQMQIDEGMIDFYMRKSETALKEVLAYLYAKSQEFGGNSRKIFTENKPEILNKTYKVQGKKVVQTGERQHGGYDEGPFLDGQKSHVILELYDDAPITDFTQISSMDLVTPLRIEEKNVVKV